MDQTNPVNKLDEILNKHKIPIAVALVGLVLLIGGIFSSGILSKTFIKQTKYPEKSLVKPQTSIKVDVSGAVHTPGVYNLPSDSRVDEAIKAAGGLREDADPEYISKSLNLAQKVSDGMKIYVSVKGDPWVSSLQQSSAQARLPDGQARLPDGQAGQVGGVGVVDINKATMDQLDKLPGVGPVTSQKIIENRPYSSIEELYTKKAVSRAVYEGIKDKVSVY